MVFLLDAERCSQPEFVKPVLDYILSEIYYRVTNGWLPRSIAFLPKI